MKLVYKIILTFMIPLVLALGLWGWLSYRTMSQKIHADTDLILKDYSDEIIMRLLSGKELPERFNGAYNTYHIESLTAEEAASLEAVQYGEAEAFLRSQEDFASSRIRRQVFQDGQGNFLRLTVSLPTFEQEVLVEHVLWWTIILFAVLLLSLIAISILALNYNMKPLYKLLAWIDRYEPGLPAPDVPSDTDIVEFRKLASTLEEAIRRIEKQYEERKIFIGNASHELQTPLAVCSNRIEMLLDRQDLNEEIATELIKIHRSLGGLVKLNKTLLLLSKIENGQFPQRSEIDLSLMLHDSIKLHQEIYGHKNIHVDLPETDSCTILIDEQMASILVGNLVKNAFAYTAQGGNIVVRSWQSGFSISNPGASSLDKDMIFRRFYQPSGRKEGATGLGLALVYSVCANNGLEVNYEFEDGHHTFCVILKKSK